MQESCLEERSQEVQKARTRVGAIPRGKIVRRPIVKKLWVNGRASEDREKWMEEEKAHCKRCDDDKEESSEVQTERIREQRRKGDSRVAWSCRKDYCRQSPTRTKHDEE